MIDLNFQDTDMLRQAFRRFLQQIKARVESANRVAEVMHGVGDKLGLESFNFLEISDVMGAEENRRLFAINFVDGRQRQVNVQLLAVLGHKSSLGATIFMIVERSRQ